MHAPATCMHTSTTPYATLLIKEQLPVTNANPGRTSGGCSIGGVVVGEPMIDPKPGRGTLNPKPLKPKPLNPINPISP